jgi:hypothetical protein
LTSFTSATKTPSDLKWLLNERAAVAGTIADALARQKAMQARLARAKRQVSELTAALAGAQTALAGSQATLSALDATLNLAYAEVDPDALGPVNVWATKYGKRGGLKEFLLQTLKDAAPAPVTTTLLINFVAIHFGLIFCVPADRERLRFSVRNTMRLLAKNGVVELLPNPTVRNASSWRLKEDDLPSFEQMARDEQEPHRGDPNPS